MSKPTSRKKLFYLKLSQMSRNYTSKLVFLTCAVIVYACGAQDGIVDPLDSTLRDFSGTCIQEFVKWSIKQTTPKQQEKSPANIKSLFKRIYSLALHPNVFKRLGAALAFNSMYRQFRSVDALDGLNIMQHSSSMVYAILSKCKKSVCSECKGYAVFIQILFCFSEKRALWWSSLSLRCWWCLLRV